jgi:glyoxylase-like metal-dependent hydrolase (beta-lactamase superfamily II)
MTQVADMTDTTDMPEQDAARPEAEPPIRAGVVPVTAFQQNCSVIWCTKTKKGAVVDPGGDLDTIMGAVEQQGIELEKILLTHGHLDHAGAATELKERTGLQIEGPQKEEIFWLEQLQKQGDTWGLPGCRDCVPDRWLDDGDTVTVGDQTLEVLHCPGHTPGHVVFFHREAGLAIVGDVIFQGSIGRTDFPRGNHEQLIDSIRKKLFPLGDDITFIPGHGPTSTFGIERQSNPFVSDLAVGEA